MQLTFCLPPKAQKKKFATVLSQHYFLIEFLPTNTFWTSSFKARVALASWVDTPFLPPGVPALILEEAKTRKTVAESKPNGKGKAKAKEVVVIESNHSDYIDIDSD